MITKDLFSHIQSKGASKRQPWHITTEKRTFRYRSAQEIKKTVTAVQYFSDKIIFGISQNKGLWWHSTLKFSRFIIKFVTIFIVFFHINISLAGLS